MQLCLAVQQKFMDDKSKILFFLSYIREILAGVWEENYMEDHFDGDQLNIGTCTDHINRPHPGAQGGCRIKILDIRS